jgi:hypothetical protein
MMNGLLDVHTSGLSNGSYNGLHGFNILSNKYIQEAKDLFLFMAEQPNSGRKRLYNETIRQLIYTGNWHLSDCIWGAAHTAQAANLNWKDPSKFTLIPIGSPMYTIDRGYAFNGIDQYLKTGFNPAANGVNFTINLNSFGVYLRDNTSGIDVDMGCRDAGGNFLQLSAKTSANMVIRNCNVTTGQIANSNSLGFHANKRTTSANMQSWKNDSKLSDFANASVLIPSFEFYIGAYNNAGTPAAFATRGNSFSFTGGDINIPLMYLEIKNYLMEIGANV